MKKNIFLLLLITLSTPILSKQTKPKLTVIFVVDQLGYRMMPNIKPYVSGGLKTLLTNGINFTSAYFPHGMPATATGHAALSTGTFAKDHGFIGNSWFDRSGNKVFCDTDSAENAAVFNPDSGTYDYGRSSKQLMVDTISDQFMLHNDPDIEHIAYSLSLKGRAAIGCAGKLGKAIWFDNKAGKFTTSKAYFDAIPGWVQTFNQTHDINKYAYYTWHVAQPYNEAAYRFAHLNTYQFTHSMAPLIKRRFPTKSKNPGGYKGDQLYSVYVQTPYANQLLLDLAQTCVQGHLDKKDNKHMLLWVSLSSLDKLGHDYGLDSKEAYDMLYHLDRQLGNFMTEMQKTYGSKNVLFALTADHGSSPITELIHSTGFSSARRFSIPDIIKQVNALIEKKFLIKNMVQHFKAPQFYLDHAQFDRLPNEQQQAILDTIINFLHNQRSIKNAWTFNQLKASCFEPNQSENFFKQQLYRGRSGDITIQTHPYVMLTKWHKGTDHRSPYEYDTHVPLIVYQPGNVEAKTITDKVWTTQFASTLAHLLGVSKPSASVTPLLPGI